MQDAMAKLEISEIGTDCLLLRCSGGLSWEDRTLLADSVERRITSRPHVGGVVLDLSAVEYINSAGIGALFQLAQRLRRLDGALILAAVPTTYLRMFRMSGLDRLTIFEDTVDGAVTRATGNASWGLARNAGNTN